MVGLLELEPFGDLGEVPVAILAAAAGSGAGSRRPAPGAAAARSDRRARAGRVGSRRRVRRPGRRTSASRRRANVKLYGRDEVRRGEDDAADARLGQPADAVGRALDELRGAGASSDVAGPQVDVALDDLRGPAARSPGTAAATRVSSAGHRRRSRPSRSRIRATATPACCSGHAATSTRRSPPGRRRARPTISASRAGVAQAVAEDRCGRTSCPGSARAARRTPRRR